MSYETFQKMKKIALFLILVCCAAHMKAQFTINGHAVPFDSQTNTWLATIPESLFGQTNQLTLSLNEGWKQITIDNEPIDNRYTFSHITAESIFQVTVTDNNEQSVTGTLQFTFLPIIQLNGEFGYEYQNGTVKIVIPEQEADDVYDANIKWRGGTTNASDKHKRNYNIKFTQDVKLFDMRNDNNWMLDAGQPDVFRLRNRIAMDIWNDMARKPYYADLEPKVLNGVRGRVVEVFLNNEYRGIYNLSEKIDRKQLKLKKADKNTSEVHGVLYKGVSWDYTVMNDSIFEYDNHSETLYGFEVKYPELDDNDSTDWKPLIDVIHKNLILSYDDLEFENQIEEWVDIPVMIDYSIFLSTVNALDNSSKNMYWAIYDKAITKKLTLTPWDLDCTFGQRWGGKLVGGENDHSSPKYPADVLNAIFYNFYRTNAHHFNEQLNERYEELRQPGNVFSTESLISRFTYYYNMLKNSGAAQRESAKWSKDTDVWGDVIDFDAEYEYICNWIREHMEFLDDRKFPVLYNDEYFNQPSTIMYLVNSSSSTNQQIHTLSGQRITHISSLKPGFYIINNKKVIVK